YRSDSGRYSTGTVYPDESHFPVDEQSTYTAAALVLGADGLAGTSPTSHLFVDHDRLPTLLDLGDEAIGRDGAAAGEPAKTLISNRPCREPRGQRRNARRT